MGINGVSVCLPACLSSIGVLIGLDICSHRIRPTQQVEYQNDRSIHHRPPTSPRYPRLGGLSPGGSRCPRRETERELLQYRGDNLRIWLYAHFIQLLQF